MNYPNQLFSLQTVKILFVFSIILNCLPVKASMAGIVYSLGGTWYKETTLSKKCRDNTVKLAADTLQSIPQQTMTIKSDVFENAFYATDLRPGVQNSKFNFQLGTEVFILLDTVCNPERTIINSHEQTLMFPEHLVYLQLPKFFQKASSEDHSILFHGFGPDDFNFPLELTLRKFVMSNIFQSSLLNREKVIRQNELRFYQVLFQDSLNGPTGTIHRLTGKHKKRFRKKVTHESFFLRPVSGQKSDQVEVFHLSITCEKQQYDWLQPFISRIESGFGFLLPDQIAL